MSFFLNPIKKLKTTRDTTIDCLKMLAMFLVVLDHCLQRWIVNAQSTQFYNFIFLTQMPLFMFISGYFTSRKFDSTKDFLRQLLKKTITLLIPFFFCSVFISLVFETTDQNPFIAMYHAILNPQLSLWFLWALFFIELFMMISIFISQKICGDVQKKGYVIMKLVFFLHLLIFPIIIYLLKGEEFLSSKLIIFYSVFFLIGHIFRTIQLSGSKEIQKIKELKSFPIIICAVSVVILGLIMYHHPQVIFEDETLTNALLRIIGSISSIALLFSLSVLANKWKPIQTISKLGMFSLELYVVHFILLKVPFLDSPLATGVVSYFIFILLYLFVLFQSFVFILLLKTNMVTDFLFFGKLDFMKKRKSK